MVQKLKGCRPSQEAMQDYSNVCAQLGDTLFKIRLGQETQQTLEKRQKELALEIDAALAQENAAAPSPQEVASAV